ncbi:MAG: ring-cleaving dioxygenase [Phycisphaeraceae bacterium]
MHLLGLHHLTAITADASGNHRFYTRTLGLRLVKKTVNQDDVSAYHLFYADGAATPGTDITFFDWPLPAEQRGTRSIARTGLRVGSAQSLAWWQQRLADAGIDAEPVTDDDARPTLHFEDPEGQRLALVVDDTPGPEHQPWSGSPVPAEHQVRGLGPVTLSVPELGPTETVLTDLLAMRRVREYQAGAGGASVYVYQMTPASSPESAAGELHVAVEPGLPAARQGAGAVHHVAFRTPDIEQYQAWSRRLASSRLPFSGEVDRYYFRSLYVREPNGILFEIATDGPGFGVDEPMAQLGERLSLPPFLEPRRGQIEAGLKPL